MDIAFLKNCVLVTLKGRFDGSSVPELHGNLQGLTDARKYDIVVDMLQVSYMSSTAWRELIRTAKVCKRWGRGELKLVIEESSPLDRVLDLVFVESPFQIYRTVEDAVKSFS